MGTRDHNKAFREIKGTHYYSEPPLNPTSGDLVFHFARVMLSSCEGAEASSMWPVPYKYKHYIYIITESEFRYVWTEGPQRSAQQQQLHGHEQWREGRGWGAQG